jgi:hypothetical protein
MLNHWNPYLRNTMVLPGYRPWMFHMDRRLRGDDGDHSTSASSRQSPAAHAISAPSIFTQAYAMHSITTNVTLSWSLR